MNIEEWNKLTLEQKFDTCRAQHLPEAFWRDVWEGLPEGHKDLGCVYQPLPASFWRDVWKGLPERHRDQVCYHQRLPATFWREVWKGLTEHQRELLKAHESISPKEARRRAREYAAKHGLKAGYKWLYAFRDHDSDGRGMWGGGPYGKGKYHRDWRCNMRPDAQNSFGFGIWPKGNTPVRVRLEDFGTEVEGHPEGKARVWGFEMI